MDFRLVVAVVFCLVVGTGMLLHGLVVYRGWVIGSHPRVVELRRRLYWHAMRTRWPFHWVLPGGVWLGLSTMALGVAVWRSATIGEDDAVGALLALGGFLGMWISIGLAWLRPSWFLAGWHRHELERERDGLPPALPSPESGPVMTMTRTERRIGFALIALVVAVWWLFSLPAAVLIPIGGLLGMMALIPARDNPQ